MRVSNTLLFTTACCAASVFAASSDLTALASAPTACTDFARIDYSSWSQSHINTWCEEHDPSSTGQCAPVTWPGDVTAPPMAHTHRGLVNWFLHRNPNLGTRKDCIALSMGFQVNTATNKKNGLSETVTCDLYDLGHDRHHECVCFPVYADATSTIRRVGDRDVVTTNTYYPPENVVKRELSSALFRKDPPIYHADYPKTVDLFSRDTKLGGSTLGGFPYCASPAAAIQPRRPPWTATLPTRGQVTMPFGTPTGPTDVCRTVPIIPTGPPTPSPRDKNCKTAWAVESCLWQFIEPYNETRRYWVTYQDIAGNGLFATWSSITISRTEPHWGLNTEDFLDPQTSETEYTTLTSQVVRTDPSGNPIYRTTETTVMPVSDDPSAVSTTATTTVSGGNTIVTTIYVPIPTTTDADWHLSTMTALGSFHRRDRSDRWKVQKCYNNVSCVDHCYSVVGHSGRFTHVLTIIGAVLGALALLSILLALCIPFLRRKWTPTATVGSSVTSSSSGTRTTIASSDDVPIRSSVLAPSAQPEVAQVTPASFGTLRRAAEEGRSVQVIEVHEGDDPDHPADVVVREAKVRFGEPDEGGAMTTGRQRTLVVEGSEQVRARVPSGQGSGAE